MEQPSLLYLLQLAKLELPRPMDVTEGGCCMMNPIWLK